MLIDECLHQDAAHFPGTEYGNAICRKIPAHVVLRSGCRVEANAVAGAVPLTQL
jgi:hypothetical protein